ncbi:hypothetical protein ATPR_1578 [Acetobacter tropicalis NBRC 101654]|uniref:Uncharacterized protein n=1 Tax=Acetobacter tropicalis NBRC 101654 TaxID=749388 RepID=F7VDX9_9PROT|nr:hypothetical protein ATPR_1578 [Acetobacter tropicalis NBRC 101654]
MPYRHPADKGRWQKAPPPPSFSLNTIHRYDEHWYGKMVFRTTLYQTVQTASSCASQRNIVTRLNLKSAFEM